MESRIENLKASFVAIEQEAKQKKKTAAVELGENLAIEQERIADAAKRLFGLVESQPDIDSDWLIMEFSQLHRQKPFSEETAHAFVDAINKFAGKQKIVKSYCRAHKDPGEFFELCFGRRPKGKVEVIRGAMTVCFRCFEESDYVFAYTHGIDETDSLASEGKVQKAKKSIGVAFSQVKEQELAGCVIAEKASGNCETQEVYKKRVLDLTGSNKNKWQDFHYPEFEDSSYIEVNTAGHGRYEIHIMRNKSDVPAMLRIYRAGASTAEAEIDLKGKITDHTIKFPVPQFGKAEYLIIQAGIYGVSFFDHTKKGSQVETTEKAGEELGIKDRELSRRIRIHEEQHQFNKLFVPGEHKDRLYRDFARLVKYQDDSEKLKPAILRKLIGHYRQIYIDPKARDEILAWCKEGSGTENTLRTLQNNNLYDYKKFKLPLTNGEVLIEDYIKLAVADGVKSAPKGGIGYWPGNLEKWTRVNFNPNPALLYTQAEVNAAVDEVLGEKYKRKLALWVGAIERLEKLGYDQKEITAFLGTLPVNSWNNYANRLAKSKKH